MGTAAPQEFDAVVIGAGVAGSLMAWRLGQGGLKVALLEAGDAIVDRAAAVAAYGASPTRSLGSPYAGAAIGPEHPGPYGAYYDEAGPEDFTSTYERIAGGTTWHWLGHTPRLLPADFKLKSNYGVGVDWPIDYATLEPWYCHAESALGVAGDDAQWANVHQAFRSQPFPMSPIWPTWSDTYVAQSIDGLSVNGAVIRVLSTPAARNSRPYDGRPPCAGNASCIPICPIGAKYDGHVHVQKALATKKVSLLANAVATRLHVNAAKRIDRVEYRLKDGARRTVSGKIVIVAANAIESSKLLLMSADPKTASRGAANSSGLVGCNLMDHMQKSVYVRTLDPVYPFRGPPSTSGIETFRDGPFRRSRSAMRFSLNNDGWGRRSVSSPAADVRNAVAQGLIGKELRASIYDSVVRQFRFSLSTEVLPERNNCVTLSDKKDADGLPRPRFKFSVGQYTRDAFGPALDIIGQMVKAMRATVVEVDTSVEPTHYSGAGHIMGGLRMGASAADGVANADGRTFDHPNLYIAGAGLFATCGTANPTLTIAALTLRMAAHIASSEFRKTLPGLP